MRYEKVLAPHPDTISTSDSDTCNTPLQSISLPLLQLSISLFSIQTSLFMFSSGNFAQRETVQLLDEFKRNSKTQTGQVWSGPDLVQTEIAICLEQIDLKESEIE